MKKDFIQLPKIIEAYFIAAENYDQTGLANCFAEDIELIDEGEKYSGPSAVSHHIGSKTLSSGCDYHNCKRTWFGRACDLTR